MDRPHDNMLDHNEFAVAMHLIQACIVGRKPPGSLPASLVLQSMEEIRVPTMTAQEGGAYRRLFHAVEKVSKNKGVLDGESPICVFMWN